MRALSVRVSPNGRYFIDENNNPLFWLGDTQWNLFRNHSLEEAEFIIKNRKEKGFSVIQVMLQGFNANTAPAPAFGEAYPDRNPAKPNLAFFSHVDKVIDAAVRNDVILAIGLDHPSINLLDAENAQAFGKWIGERYRQYSNIIWVPSYFIPEGRNLEIMRGTVQGLQAADKGTHLITCHPDPAHPVISSGLIHDKPWLSFHCIQTFSSIDLIVESITKDYQREPPKPVVLAEGAYENGPEYGYEVTPLLIRNQAYLSYFAGGHHSYGHNDNWRVLPTWRLSLDSPGSQQMSVLREIFTSLRWWELQPDQDALLKDETAGNPINSSVLRSESGDTILIYSCTPGSFCLRMDSISSASAIARWIDPRNGEMTPAGCFPTSGIQKFQCPNGLEDSILMMSAVDSGKVKSDGSGRSPVFKEQ